MRYALLFFLLTAPQHCIIRDIDEPCKVEEYYNDDNGQGFNCYS